MTSLSFPDVNVWLALAAPEHVHARTARSWWKHESGRICFSRFSQLALLRLMTTASAMDKKPLSISDAWKVYDQFYADDRVAFIAEPRDVELHFRKFARVSTISPKIWADGWLLAVAKAAGGVVVTLDRAMAARGAHCLLGTAPP